MPEYRAVRAGAGDFIALCTNPALAAEVTLQPVRRFGMDGAILFSDILMVPWAMGHGLEYREGEGPVLPRVEVWGDVERLDVGGIGVRAAPIFETVRRVRAGVGEAALIGFAGGPWTVACYMVEGRGSKEFARARLMAWREPELFAGLMERLERATVEYLVGQAEAGAEALMLFESWAGVLAPPQFERWVVEPTRRIVAAVRGRCPGVRVVGFARGAGVGTARYGQEVDAVALDTSVDVREMLRILGEDVVTQGNLDPMALVAGGEVMREAVGQVLEAVRVRAHVFNLGHGVVPETPPEHVAALVARVREG